MKAPQKLKIGVLVLFFLISLTNKSQNALTSIDSALIACYPFTGNANDLSGNGNNGTVNGAVLASDRFGNTNAAYSFNGSNQNIIIPNFSNKITSNEISLSFWATTSAYATRSAFLMTPDDPSNRFNVHIYYGNQLSNSQTFWDFGNISNNGRLYISTSPLPATNGWDHWVFTSSALNGNMKCYKNGVLQLTSSGSSAFSTATLKDLLIGGGVGVNSSFLWFSGKLDDIRIYKRVLTAGDVSQLYNNNVSCVNCVTAQQPTNTTNPANLSICAGNAAVLSVNGSSVNWYTSATSSVSIASGSVYTTPAYSVAGVYTYYAKSTNSCSTSSAVAISVTVNALPVLSISQSATLVCKGQSATVTVAGASTYTWSNGLNGNSVVLSPSVTSTYTVTGTNANGCKTSTTFQLAVKDCNSVGLNEQTVSEPNFVIYPNPNTGRFNVSLTQVNNASSVDVFNLLGECVLHVPANSSTISLDLSHLAKGLYNLRLMSKDKVLKQEKLVLE